MISQLAVRNFQSLHDVSMDLGRFTVIVGPSSSGKSATTRALRTLTSNRRGSDFISHGERLTVITGVFDNGTVTLKRGKATKDNEYIVRPTGGEPKSYTKLDGTTPPEVSEFIGIPSKDPINYAGQFDKPYLLDETGAEVARVFGSLTNVHVIFEAARESNRRKLATAATLRTRAEDLQQIRERAEHYRPLKQQIAAITEAEKNLEQARDIQLKIAKLKQAVDTLSQAAHAVRQLTPILESSVPDIEQISDAAARLQAAHTTWGSLIAAAGVAKQRKQDIAAHTEAEESLAEQYTAALTAAAVCPTCGQSTTGAALERHHG